VAGRREDGARLVKCVVHEHDRWGRRRAWLLSSVAVRGFKY
jgi:hypothetical protein